MHPTLSFSAIILIGAFWPNQEIDATKCNQPPQALERYEIEEIKLNAKTFTIKEHEAITAYGPDGYIYTLKKGDSIGKNFGTVEELESHYMLIREIHSCGKDLWQLKWITYLAASDGPNRKKFVKFREITEPCH